MIAVRIIALDLPSRAQGTHNRNNRALIRSSYGFVLETPFMKLSMCGLGKGLSTIQNIFGVDSSP
jgi:hypothetical protein